MGIAKAAAVASESRVEAMLGGAPESVDDSPNGADGPDLSTAPVITRRVVDGVAITQCDPPGTHRAPMLLVHGGCHGAWQWEPWLPWLARSGRTVMAIDWFSHGVSRRLEHDEWVHRGILDVRTEIGVGVDQAPGSPVLIGHSMGGLASLAYAADHPGRIAALVLLSPVVPARFGGAPIEVPVDREGLWPVPPPEIARQLWFDAAPEAHLATIYDRLQPESPQAVWEATRWTVELALDALDVPVLVVVGARDQLTPPDVVAGLAEGIGAAFITLDGVGHGVAFDPGWPALCERIDGWLRTAEEPGTDGRKG
jgi:pimeloyl-ACP methyl ester carboxylesterase